MFACAPAMKVPPSSRRAEASGFQPCAFARAEHDLEEVTDCVKVAGPHEIRVHPLRLAEMDFNEDGLASIYIGAQSAYVTRAGKAVVMFTFDNGPDDFSEGLARFVGPNGKIGFVDQTLNVVIPARFDFATPFEDGRAHICMGCRKQQDGEHTTMVGGERASIDRAGNVEPNPTAAP